MGAQGHGSTPGELSLTRVRHCELLGVDDEYRDQWLKWSEAFTTFVRPDPEILPPALHGMVDTVIRLIGARRAQPGDDLISDLVQVSDETEKLDEVELVALVLVLVQTGLDTVRHSISLGFFNLLTHPDQLELVKTQPENTVRAVRELMRYSGPVKTALPRFAAEPIEVDGVTILKDGQIQRRSLPRGRAQRVHRAAYRSAGLRRLSPVPRLVRVKQPAHPARRARRLTCVSPRTSSAVDFRSRPVRVRNMSRVRSGLHCSA
ncbi:hypothetical protein AQJ23_27690 [Streptomyces antibioticus]|nr:cytochrome P450 [Streptomyces antibioticus]KUN21850.1 hypothetical protein AQJ23_27690 [Streptomyces antibioticus]